MFQLRIFLSWNDVGSSWWGCEPRDYARSGRWPPLTPSLGSQPHHSAPTSIHSGKIPSWNKIFCDLGYPLSKSLAGKFKVFPSWSIFILSCLKEQENIIRCPLKVKSKESNTLSHKYSLQHSLFAEQKYGQTRQCDRTKLHDTFLVLQHILSKHESLKLNQVILRYFLEQAKIT